jgi:hypothetical protein
MKYGVWNRDYDLHKNGVDHLVAKRRDPSAETRNTHTQKTALHEESPPNR